MTRDPADLVDPALLPPCVPRPLFDRCAETFLAIASLTDRPSGLPENRPRVGVTWSPSLMCKLQAAEGGVPLVVVPLGLIARVYTLALVLAAHDGGIPVEFAGDEREVLSRLTAPPGLAAVFEPSGETFWDDLGRVQDAFGATGARALAEARTTATLAAAFFVCHEVGHWARMDDLVTAPEEEFPPADLRRGVEVGADASGAQILTMFTGHYPRSVPGAESREERWDAALYALAVGFALFGVHLREEVVRHEGVYYDAVIRHQICLDAARLTVRRGFPEEIEAWDSAESRAWSRYRARFGALRAAALAGAFGGTGLPAPRDVLGRSGSAELTGTLAAARAIHDRVADALPGLRGRRSSAEFDVRFDDDALHRYVETVPSTSIGANLLRRWETGPADGHPVGAALVSTVVDLRVAGYDGPIGHDDVFALHRHYLPEATPAATEEHLAAEVEWACERLGGAAACVSWVGWSSFEPDRSLTIVVQEPDRVRRVPSPVLRWAIERIDDPDDLLVLAVRALWTRDLEIAGEALGKLARHRPEIAREWEGTLAELRGDADGGIGRREETTRPDDSAGLNRLGLLYLRAGDLDKAESLFRPPAAAGRPAALCNMGLVEERRGRLETAKLWWERASAAGDVRAMNNLGMVAYSEGDHAAARAWFGRAADSGDLLALYNLGVLAQERGDLDDAEAWWRVAADSGSTDAMVDLARLLAGQGRDGEARAWLRDTAQIARRQLAADPGLRAERLALGETLKQWDDRVDDAREPGSIRNYALLLLMMGDTGAALPLLAQARDLGDEEAADLLTRITPDPPKQRSRFFPHRRRHPG
ncbi:tetratricopeptide repeat protein [Bailinhaonella thermotolerans]|uniref:Sel1 repeat family protein n=1 Tax=Bailinhaonella thermotolerans TaxID=1070861 RepID=A0A3A4BW46_9ACTN|nr:sel1 repeat family protein [Bailinhaonella thermotolerans]RJL35818.1 sel1 repeat family protein [Bailinhaonella thermotolerans]